MNRDHQNAPFLTCYNAEKLSFKGNTVEQVEYSISRVERETSISKDILRMWERRYGFPAPVRMPNGVRTYCANDIERLIRIKKLVDLGHRPGKLIDLTEAQLDAILAMPVASVKLNPPTNNEANVLLQLLTNGELRQLEQRLKVWLLRYGLEAFVTSLMPDLLKLIGDRWQTGEMQVYQEHWLSELLQTLLRHSLAKLPEPTQPHPKVLLTTLPQELHGLGLLMIEVLLTLENTYCINLGVNTPVESIIKAVAEYNIDVVCLSLSEAVSTKLAMQQLKELDQQLPSSVVVWLGGAGVAQVKPKSGRFKRQSTLNEIIKTALEWRST